MKLPARIQLSSLAVLAATACAVAQPGSPAYSIQVSDPNTGLNRYLADDGRNRWSVASGADVYSMERYERPTAQTYYHGLGRYGAQEYFEFLDIEGARAGSDQRWLYVSINLVGRDKIVVDGTRSAIGLLSKYGFKFSANAEGRHGFLVISDQPEVKNGNPFQWGPLGTFVFQDTNGDVGGAADSGPTGLTVSKSQNALEEQGMNGYETPIVSDGRDFNERTVLFVRLNPADPTIVELALDYTAMGFTAAQVQQLRYFDVLAVKGNDDPQKFHLNDKYSASEAGSPNPGSNGGSEFGSEGCLNINEIDTARLIGAGMPAQYIRASGGGLVPRWLRRPIGMNVSPGVVSPNMVQPAPSNPAPQGSEPPHAPQPPQPPQSGGSNAPTQPPASKPNTVRRGLWGRSRN